MQTRNAKALVIALICCLLLTGVAYAGPANKCADGKNVAAKKTVKTVTVKKVVVKKAVVKKTVARKAVSKFGTLTGSTFMATETTSTTTTSTGGTKITTTTVEKALKNVHLRLVLLKTTKKGVVRTKITRATQSDRNGFFRFKNVKPGTYWLKVWAKNAQPVNSKLIQVEVKAGANGPLKVLFKPAPKKTPVKAQACAPIRR